MEELYPTVTQQELDELGDKTCIICREEMELGNPGGDRPSATPISNRNNTPKKLPCGHIFHFHCLRSWLERQQSCPTW
jgi:E3 ubiquitin-protein ligase synoviolin